MSLHTWHCQHLCKPSSCAAFTFKSHWAEMPQAKKMSFTYAHRVASAVSDSLQPCGLWPARLLCQRGGISRQEYWSVLANTGCHPLLEHCISCSPSHQLP